MKAPVAILRNPIILSVIIALCALGFSAFSDAASTNPNTNLTLDQQASRFFGQATCGATQKEIDDLAAALKKTPNTAYVDWIERKWPSPLLTPTSPCPPSARKCRRITRATVTGSKPRKLPLSGPP